ncbi:MAG: hypothetical protein FWE70_05320, partial [Oscillospiraceae bacterium]|nr:hypothetical protein [Oscillospiraceae bacterium]
YGFEGYDVAGSRFPFLLLMVDPEFQAIYKGWVTALFREMNPYTGLRMCDDPGVAIFEIQNEDSFFFWTTARATIAPTVMGRMDASFGAWLAGRYGSCGEALAAWGEGAAQPDVDRPDDGVMKIMDAWFYTDEGRGTPALHRRMADQLEFLATAQKDFYDGMVAFLRDELEVKALISCSNWTTASPKYLDAIERYTYTAGDIIDRHGYYTGTHTGPTSGYRVSPGDYFSDSSLLYEPWNSVTHLTKVEGYPHMISETGWPSPNMYRAESVAVWSLYGSLEGMDVITMFAVGSVNAEPATNKFAMCVPTVLWQFPGYALLYRRGDVEEARTVVAMTHNLSDMYDFKGSEIHETQAIDQLRQD